MKKTISIILCLAFLLCMCLFSGCEKDKTLSSTGEYNGQTITLSYDSPTDIPFPSDMGNMQLVNGYVVFYDYTNYAEDGSSGFNAFDLNGQILFDKRYSSMTHFDESGWCAVFENSGGSAVYRMLHAGGKTYLITEAEYLQHSRQFISERIYPPVPEGVTPPYAENALLTGPLYNGLSAFVEYRPDLDGINNHLLGICDQDGNVVIPAFIPICHDQYTNIVYMNEDVIVFNDNGKIAIAKIVRE